MVAADGHATNNRMYLAELEGDGALDWEHRLDQGTRTDVQNRQDDTTTIEASAHDVSDETQIPMNAPSENLLATSQAHDAEDDEDVLRRPSRGGSWIPVAKPPPEPRPSDGLFIYEASALPIPLRPPRPVLDASVRIERAPFPGMNTSPFSGIQVQLEHEPVIGQDVAAPSEAHEMIEPQDVVETNEEEWNEDRWVSEELASAEEFDQNLADEVLIDDAT